jgi:hypothetical protein
MNSMSDMDWNRNQENIVIKQIAITSTNKLNVTAENDGPVQSHLIWLGIFNKTATPENQTYQALNEFVRPGETDNIVSNFTVTAGNMYVMQLVTELGNTVESKFYPANFASCALTLVTTPPTVYQGNNVTVLFTVTLNDTVVDSIQSLTATLNATPTNLVQLVSNSPLSASGVTRGTTTFFWWTYNATSIGTVTFNATYLQAPSGTYALSTAQIVIPPQQGGQGSVTVTGVNCTASQNPSQWTPLGSTQNASVPTSYLASNDSNYAVFGSYYTGSTVSANSYVSNNVSNVDNSSGIGTHSNFTAMQYGPDSNYDNLTEQATMAWFWQEDTSGYSAEPQSYYDYEWWSDWTTNSTTSGTITTIGIYVFANPGNSPQVKLGIYDDYGGNPNHLIAYTNPATIAVSQPAWLDVDIVWPQGGLSISPSTTYHVAHITDKAPTTLWRGQKAAGGLLTSDYRQGRTWSNLFDPAGFVGSATQNRHGAYRVGYRAYALDLEAQWTGLNPNQQNAFLYIYGGTMGAENILVDVWTGSWQNVFPDLITGLNNQSVKSYLTSSNFTIRFRDQNLDIVQDTWQIDACLLQLSNTTDQYTAEVEFTGSSDLQNWTSLAWQIDSAWNTSSVNVTIQCYNYTLPGGYVSSGAGYISYTSNPTPNTDEWKSQNTTLNPTSFRNSTTGYWKVKIKGVSNSTQFQMKVNWIELQDSYAYVNDIIPYKAWQWYTIQAIAVSGNPVPFTYASLYANGTTVTFQNAKDGTPVPNPAWLQLDANGTFQLQVRSITSSGEIFVLYVAVGTVVQQKMVTQAAQ